jgi:internalin A
LAPAARTSAASASSWPAQFLGLASTKVTDAGLKELAGLKSLQSLVLVGTKVTPTGVAELRKALPKLLILE